MSSSPPSRPVGMAVVGLGFMGATHVRCIASARDAGYACRLAAVCDPDASRRSGVIAATGNLKSAGEGKSGGERLFDPGATRAYADADELFADPEVDAVSICTHTDTHADLAVRALMAGKHVLVEKPVAVSVADIERVKQAASGAGRICMPAMCMRFWPGWPWVRERILDGTYGRVLSATFHRLGTPPTWSPDFYRNADRSGGALVDLHIHDADFIRWTFGDPDSVVSTGTTNHLTTLYRYANGPSHVVAEGGWGHTPGFGFRMQYVIAFERATVDFDFSRTPTVYLSRDGQREAVELPTSSAYEIQMRHFVDLVAGRIRGDGAGTLEMTATLEDAMKVAKLLDAERASLASGAAVQL